MTTETKFEPTKSEYLNALHILYLETLQATGGGYVDNVENPHLRDALIHAMHMLDFHVHCSALCNRRNIA